MQRVEKSLNKEDRFYIVHELTCIYKCSLKLSIVFFSNICIVMDILYYIILYYITGDRRVWDVRITFYGKYSSKIIYRIYIICIQKRKYYTV